MTSRSRPFAEFPRIGDRRELKTATEGYWAGRVPAEELEATARELRAARRGRSCATPGVGRVPSNHFSLYDQVLDTCVLVGAVPERYGDAGDVDLGTYFAMARAGRRAHGDDQVVRHQLPLPGPRARAGHEFRLAARPKPLVELAEARELGVATRPVLLGPVTFLLGKPADGARPPSAASTCSTPLLEVRRAAGRAGGGRGRVGAARRRAGVRPGPVATRELDALGRAYDRLSRVGPAQAAGLSYSDHPGRRLEVLAGAPVDRIGLDLTRDSARNLDLLAAAGGIGDRTLVAGVVDSRNVWVNDLGRSLSYMATLLGLAGEVIVSTSCSLQHVPIDLDAEQALDPRSGPGWPSPMKVAEVVTPGPRTGRGHRGHRRGAGRANQRTALADAGGPGRTHDPAVRRLRLDAIQRASCVGPRRTRSARRPSGPARPAAAAHHHHRLLPPDRRGPAGPRRPAAGAGWTRPATRRACATRSPRSSGSRTGWSSTCWSTGPERSDMVGGGGGSTGWP